MKATGGIPLIGRTGAVSFAGRPLYPREGTSSTHWICGWLCTVAGLLTFWKREKFLSLSRIEGNRIRTSNRLR